MSCIEMKTSFFTILCCFSLWIDCGNGLLGYDCGKQYLSTKKYSATEVEECPEIPGWFDDPIPVEIQLIRIPKKEILKAKVCEVRVTKIVHFCGKLDSLLYGVPIMLEKDKPFKISKRDCERLVREKMMTFAGESWYTDEKEFSRDIVVHGSRDAESGTCSAATFRSNGKAFEHHVMRKVVSVRILDEDYEYNYEDQAVRINKHVIALTDGYYETDFRTLIWDNPYKQCTLGSNFKKAYEGKGLLYRPTNTNLLDMILVHHESTSQTFGVELKSVYSRCGHTMYSTQLQDVKITVNRTEYNGGDSSWKIHDLPATNLQYVDPVQNLKALVGFNYVSQAAHFSDAISELASHACEDRRRITQNNLSILRIDPSEGVYLMYGRGFNGLLRGSVFYLYQCEEKQFQYREVEEDFQDIPVFYNTDEDEIIEGFLDSITLNFKESSIYYSNKGVLPVMYNWGGNFKCKQGDLIDCGDAEQLAHNFDNVLDGLKHKASRVKYDGGVDDFDTRRRFRESVEEANDIKNSVHFYGGSVVNHQSEEDLFSIFNLDDIKATIINTSWMGNLWRWVYKGLIIFGCLVGIWFVGVRCQMFRNAANLAGDMFKSNKWNIMHAFLNSSLFHSNYNMTTHKKVQHDLKNVHTIVKSHVVEISEDGKHNHQLEDSLGKLQALGEVYPKLPDSEPSPDPMTLSTKSSPQDLNNQKSTSPPTSPNKPK